MVKGGLFNVATGECFCLVAANTLKMCSTVVYKGGAREGRSKDAVQQLQEEAVARSSQADGFRQYKLKQRRLLLNPSGSSPMLMVERKGARIVIGRGGQIRMCLVAEAYSFRLSRGGDDLFPEDQSKALCSHKISVARGFRLLRSYGWFALKGKCTSELKAEQLKPSVFLPNQ